MRFGDVSLEWVAGYLVRYHPRGGGADTPHSFAVMVTTDESGRWWFKGAGGRYTRAAAKAIRVALSRAGFPRVSRLSGYGARERTLVMEAIKMKDLDWKAVVTYAGEEVGGQHNWWKKLPDDEIKKMDEEGNKVVAYAKGVERKGGGYTVTFTGSKTDSTSGAVETDPEVAVEMDLKAFDKYMDRAEKLSEFLRKWLHADAETGKKTAWDHGKKKPKEGEGEDEE